MEDFVINFDTFGAAVGTFFQVVGAILSGQRGVIADVHNQTDVLLLSFMVVLLAGLSEAIGQSVVLFVNEVKPRRFVASLIVSAILFAGGYVLWVSSTWAVAAVLFRPEASILDVMRAVGIGYAPLLFGFLSLIPYFGRGINNVLYFWAFIAIVSAVSITLDLSFVRAVVVSIAGGLMILRLRATFGKPLVKLARRVRNVAAGTRLQLKVQDAVNLRDFWDD